MQSSTLKMFAILGALGAFGCGSKPTNPTQTPTPGPIVISIVANRGNTSFTPNPALAAGQMVVFRNADTEAHKVSLNDLTVSWGTIAPGATSPAFRMPSDGTNYHCDLHPTMIGAVALDAATPPPTCQGVYC
jgi:plastocyanin